jgi:hypothetical protein
MAPLIDGGGSEEFRDHEVLCTKVPGSLRVGGEEGEAGVGFGQEGSGADVGCEGCGVVGAELRERGGYEGGCVGGGRGGSSRKGSFEGGKGGPAEWAVVLL